MSLLRRIFGHTGGRAALAPLYRAIVAAARDPAWYRDGRVPDTMDGRFDMVAAVTALVLLRLEAEGEAGRASSALLTELFVEDMDGILRQIGIGDQMVGKHVGRMIGALGGRLAALREARALGDFEAAVRRNLFHDDPPADESVALVAGRLARLATALDSQPSAALLRGEVPGP